MKTLSLNSKRCSTAENPGFSCLFAIILFGISGAASLSHASTPGGSPELLSRLRKDIQQAPSGSSFESLLKGWKQNYGTPAVSPLLQLASNQQMPDHQRYMALMGAAQIGGPAVADLILPLLKDPSWMIRSGALRALTALHGNGTPVDTRNASAILPLLRDSALVVRMEAIQTVEALKLPGTEEALLSILNRPENYHHNKAQWVPQRALSALQTLGSRQSIAAIKPLLEHTQDPELQKIALRTLESLSGKSVMASLNDRPLAEQIRYWKKIARQ